MLFSSRGSTGSGGNGDDYVLVVGGRATLNGNEGNDKLSAGGYGNVLEGGTGDDIVTVFGGAVYSKEYEGETSYIKFAAGDGKDTVRLLDAEATLQLGEGLSSQNARISTSDGFAVLTFEGNDSDQITIAMTSKSNLTIAFADGSEMKLDGAQFSSKQIWEI